MGQHPALAATAVADSRKALWVLTAISAVVLLWSGIGPYDRIGHFAQGFVPAIVARELLLRHTPLQRGGWLFTIVAGMCLAVSACYEFIEWSAALIGGGDADAFLGTQGDVPQLS